MNWEEIGAIGQVLGSVAVFITLGYLAVQVKHARQDVRRSINQSRFETIRKFNMTDATDERLGNLNRKAHMLLGGPEFPFVGALVERTGMAAEEAMAISWYQMAWWHYRLETIPYLSELPDGERFLFDFGIKNYRNLPVQKLWYEATKPYLNPDVVRYVDNVLAQPG